MARIPNALSPKTEVLIYRVIGCCIAVHRVLGPGLPERAYSRAVGLELEADGIPFDRERRFEVIYRDCVVCTKRVDFVIDNQLVLELKAVERLDPVHTAQALTYLRLARLRAGLIVNFNVAVLQEGLRRVIL
jgi:GxxExxY protein